MKSQYSIGRAILTLDAPSKNGDIDENSPVSIFDIAQRHKLREVVLVDNSISGFLEAHQSAKEIKVKLIYGLMLNCIEDIDNKNENSLKTLHKIIVFIKNTNGYKDLIRISSFAAQDGFYYKPNIDCKNLKKLWTSNLLLAIPFYDSFLFNNTLENFICIPDFSFTNPLFLIENNLLPFDKIMQQKVQHYAVNNNFSVVRAKTIMYYKRADFLAYLTFRCIHNRSNIAEPELEHFSSAEFCFEAWEEQNKNPKYF